MELSAFSAGFAGRKNPYYAGLGAGNADVNGIDVGGAPANNLDFACPPSRCKGGKQRILVFGDSYYDGQLFRRNNLAAAAYDPGELKSAVLKLSLCGVGYARKR